MDLIHVWDGDRYRSICISVHDPKVNVTDFFMLTFRVQVFTVTVFAKPMIDLIYVWYSDSNLSKVVRGTIASP